MAQISPPLRLREPEDCEDFRSILPQILDVKKVLLSLKGSDVGSLVTSRVQLEREVGLRSKQFTSFWRKLITWLTELKIK
jgi:hypothetical protein